MNFVRIVNFCDFIKLENAYCGSNNTTRGKGANSRKLRYHNIRDKLNEAKYILIRFKEEINRLSLYIYSKCVSLIQI